MCNNYNLDILIGIESETLICQRAQKEARLASSSLDMMGCRTPPPRFRIPVFAYMAQINSTSEFALGEFGFEGGDAGAGVAGEV